SLGYTQTSYLSLIQYDSFTSVYGVSFWVPTLNVIFFQITKNWKNTKKCLALILLVLVLFLLPWIYGKKVIPKEGQYQEKIRIALIQGNIDPYVKWDENFRDLNFKTYHRLTEAAALQRPDLLVWPETATPCYLRYDFKYLEQVQSLVDELGIPLLTGSPDFEYISSNMYHTYNSALLLLPNQSQIQSYAKLHLVPFGERVPFEDSFPFSYLKSLLDKLELGQGDFSPGKETVVFQFQTQGEKGSTESIKFSVVICYESIFPELVREFVVKGAQFLIIITNDAWFGKTSAPYHHAQIAIFRAIENRISIGRCANTGVSMFIDSYGRTLMASPIFKEEVLVSDIPLRQEKTFFTRYGNVFSSAILVFNVFPLGLALLHKRTAGPGCN
ncbi:MAG: apolipoprotein N-acyltransferase, partial [candidate division KSB1 bacterium]|nr:apolipoprotein N-acyltransferase [candidate division KSB1 bacterium]